MRIHRIISPTFVDGPGERAALFLQGCLIGCTACQNQHLWPIDGGQEVPLGALVEQLLATGLPITLTGGEPFQQPIELAQLVTQLKAASRHVIVYSGYTFEELIARAQIEPAIEQVLQQADVLVDGPYVVELDNAFMQYRGSANQRPIDLPATFASGQVVTLDWDTPEIVVTRDGSLLAPIGLAAQFTDLGTAETTRRCGQTK
jgi:anaerobic ribonucleoside-triphosphate reductase activating protein